MGIEAGCGQRVVGKALLDAEGDRLLQLEGGWSLQTVMLQETDMVRRIGVGKVAPASGWCNWSLLGTGLTQQ